MLLIKRLTGISLCMYCLALSQLAVAMDGYFPHGRGTKNKAMAGAGMAMPEDAISIVNNPAVAAFIDDRMDVGLSLFMPRRNFTSIYGGSQGRNNTFTFDDVHTDSDKELYLMPEIAGTHALKNDSAFAWAVYMRNGIGVSLKGGAATFDPDGDGPLPITRLPGTYGDDDTTLDLSQLFTDITWAKKWGKNTAIGVSAVLAAQSLEVKGTGGLAKYTRTFAASGGAELPDKLGGNGRDIDYGAGLKLGIHQLLGDHFSAGVMYQTEIDIGSSGKYSDLLAGGGDLDIPAWIRAGITWRPVDRISLSIDAQNVFYSDIDTFGNSFTNIYQCPTAGMGGEDLSRCLGGEHGPGFAWKDVLTFNFGGSWEISPRWTIRAGMSISDQPVPSDENFFNTLLIDLSETNYTAGFTRILKNGHELGFSFMYSEEESMEHINQLDPNQVLILTNDQFDFQISYSWEH